MFWEAFHSTLKTILGGSDPISEQGKSSQVKSPFLFCQYHDSKQTGTPVSVLKCILKQCIIRLSEKLLCVKEVGGGVLILTSEMALPFST